VRPHENASEKCFEILFDSDNIFLILVVFYISKRLILCGAPRYCDRLLRHPNVRALDMLLAG
jgi:hypothetical protein